MENKITEILTQLQTVSTEFATKLAPQALDAILLVTKINGASNIIKGLIILVCSFLVIKYFNLKIKNWKPKNEWDDMNDVYNIAKSCIVVVAMVVLTGVVLNVWNWVAIVKPELVIAKQIIDKVKEK